MIFLSASIPVLGREFHGTEDVIAIREAIMAFTKVCMDDKIPFYFGGHPAITPLVWEVAKDYAPNDFKEFIRIYQSAYFIDKTPKEVSFFENIVWTDKKDDIPSSVTFMRNQMFSENKTTVAVFIGGMKGVLDECDMIKEYNPDVKILPIATTGAASRELYKRLNINNPDLEDNYSYVSVFRRYLK